MVVLLSSTAVIITAPLCLRRLSQIDMAVYYSYGRPPSRQEREKFQQRSAAHPEGDDRGCHSACARGRFAFSHRGGGCGGRLAGNGLPLLPYARVFASRGARARPRGGFGRRGAARGSRESLRSCVHHVVVVGRRERGSVTHRAQARSGAPAGRVGGA